MANRLTTGLAGLDAQLGGGIPQGTVHALFGEPMNAFELLPYHFAVGGARQGKGTTILTTQSDEPDILEGVARVGGDAKKVHVVGLHGGETLPEAPPGQRLVLTSFSGLAAGLGWEGAFEAIKDLKGQMRRNGDNLLITVTVGLHTPEQMQWLKMWADGVLELGFDRQGFGLYPFLKVTKMRGVPDSARFLLFKETEKGLFMESTKRVF